MRHGQRGGLADTHGVHAGLRHVDVRSQRSDLRDAVQQRASGADERADVDVAQRDHAVERRLDDAVSLDLLQAGKVRLDGDKIAPLREDGLFECLHAGVLRRQLSLRLISILQRRDAFLDEHLHALSRDARKLAVRLALREARLRLLHRGLRLLDGRFCLVNLLIQFRRVDFREHLAHLHPVSDVRQATFEIAVGAREDGRLREPASCRAASARSDLRRGSPSSRHTRQAFLLRIGSLEAWLRALQRR
jgi:hypothetical protein